MVQQDCVDCRAKSPDTETPQTLISETCGWRVTRTMTPDGVKIEWRCPDCWTRFKEARQHRA